MLCAAPPTPRRDRTAIAISIAVHCCVLAVLALLPGATFPVSDPDERTLLIGQIRIDHLQRQHIGHTKRPPAVPVIPQQQAPRPVVRAAVATSHASHKMLVAPEARAAYVPVITVKLKPTPAPRTPNEPVTRLAAVATEPAVEAPAQAAPTTAPAARAASPAPAQHDDGIGNFGETYPASVEPSLRATLFAGISGIVVRITVDESGRATSIEFLRPPADATQREELRTRLLAAHFIPANCNGLRCSGTVELKN